MASRNEPQFVRPREAFTGEGDDGVPFVANPTEVFSIDHPIVKAHRGMFVAIQSSHPVVEQMTAAPGERRG